MGSVRKLLVIADDSPEWRDALVYAGFRARNTGAGVVVLRTLEPARFEHWAGVREELRRQALSDAEAALRLRLAEVRDMEFLGSYWRTHLAVGAVPLIANFSMSAVRRFGIEPGKSQSIDIPSERVLAFPRAAA